MGSEEILLIVDQMTSVGQGFLIGAAICVALILGVVFLIVFQNDSARWKGSESRKRLAHNHDVEEDNIKELFDSLEGLNDGKDQIKE